MPSAGGRSMAMRKEKLRMAKVLVIDDDMTLLAMLTDALRNRGHEVIPCSSATEAVERFKPPQIYVPDLVISDVMMPGLDGFSLNGVLQQDDRTRKVPVIIMSAKAKLRHSFEGLGHVVAFLEKPFDLKVLYEAIEKALKKAK